ncbi:MAG TPA: hypothetical protein VGP93_13345, partial [Polyangiaceae bacterium]|nr:hypothetical protein [Polyangiaceae bacterium]
MLLRGHALTLALVFAAVGCSSHSDRMKPVRSALDAQSPREALKRLNDELDVDSERELPEDLRADDATLLLLDRAMVLQQLEKYQL